MAQAEKKVNVVGGFRKVQDAVTNYIKETWLESKKVIWPSQKYVTTATIIVLVIVFIVAAFVLCTDWMLARVFGLFARPGA